METFGQKIKRLRVKAGLTQTQLANELGISTSAISMYEQDNREPNREMLLALSSYFGVGTDYLLTDKGERLCDVNQLLTQLKSRLDSADGLMLNGVMLDEDDRCKLFDAMKVAANVMFADRINKKEGKDNND